MTLFILAAVLGAAMLIFGADRVVGGASSLAENLGVSPLIIGLTVVSLGTSLPELLVTTTASLTGHPDVAVGNILGSNIANIGLILGLTSIVRPVLIHSTLLTKEYPFLLMSTGLAWVFAFNGLITRGEGALLFGGLVLILVWLGMRAARGERDPILESATSPAAPARLPLKSSVLYLAAGLVLLVAGSRMLVYGGVGIAEGLGVPKLVIGLTLMALGTSLPELATTLAGALKGQDDIAVGNVVGSNLFNTLGILGIPAMLQPLSVSRAAIVRDFPVMIFACLALWPICASFRGLKGRVNRLEGAALFTGYAIYVLVLFRGSLF